MFMSSRDIEELSPTGNEYVNLMYTFEDIILYVTYDLETYPTVTTQAVTNVENMNVKGNGTLTDGGTANTYGFQYGLTETPTWEISKTTSIEEGTFSLSIYGLEPSTTYYYRAFATNSKGTAYGGWISFTTAASPSYGIYEESNSPTICFYISEDDGHTWGHKYGPYTTDQADIEITKLLVRGSGKKKIKFTSNTLTGISASIMCKLDLKAR